MKKTNAIISTQIFQCAIKRVDTQVQHNECKDHFRDIDCGTKESKIQDKRLDILRKVNFRMVKYGIGILPMGISGRVQIE